MKWEEVPYQWDKAHCMDFYGGDFYGVIEKLDYLQDLGVNAIYFNPIFISPTIHKYDALDYFEIDPSLGGEEGLAKLCDEIHKRNMKIILDISINHTSSSSKWFNMDGLFMIKVSVHITILIQKKENITLLMKMEVMKHGLELRLCQA